MTHRTHRIYLAPDEARCDPGQGTEGKQLCARYRAEVPRGTPMEDYSRRPYNSACGEYCVGFVDASKAKAPPPKKPEPRLFSGLGSSEVVERKPADAFDTDAFLQRLAQLFEESRQRLERMNELIAELDRQQRELTAAMPAGAFYLPMPEETYPTLTLPQETFEIEQLICRVGADVRPEDKLFITFIPARGDDEGVFLQRDGDDDAVLIRVTNPSVTSA